MQKRASYKEVYQLYKKAGWWDNVKSDLGKAWDSFNSYADKNQWVRPALYGAGGALGGYGLGSFFKNPLLRVLFAILGGAGGLYGGLKHNDYRPAVIANRRTDKVNKALAETRKLQKQQSELDSIKPENQLAAQNMSGSQYADYLAKQKADQQAAGEAAMRAQAAKPVAEKPAGKVSYKATLNDPVYRKAFFGKTLEEKLKEDAAKGAEAAAKK